jgi:hypothetical protein
MIALICASLTSLSSAPCHPLRPDLSFPHRTIIPVWTTPISPLSIMSTQSLHHPPLASLSSFPHWLHHGTLTSSVVIHPDRAITLSPPHLCDLIEPTPPYAHATVLRAFLSLSSSSRPHLLKLCHLFHRAHNTSRPRPP